MCGIAGIVGAGLPETCERTVRGMMAAIAHRGPDGEGFLQGDSFAFGHRRLSVIDLSPGGAQPQQTEDGRFVLMTNGEIYNYVELRRELEVGGIGFRSMSDTEVLLRLLARDGEGALSRISGIFAFALFDRAERSLLLARDHFGVKPLYYFETPDGGLVFASEIKALLQHPAAPRKCSRQALEQYLAFQFCMDDLTLFDGIKKLQPGCLLKWSREKGGRVSRYWDLNFRVDEHHDERYFIERLEHQLETAIRQQLRSDVPLGAYLSGGIDSSFVSAQAQRTISHPLQVFHGRFHAGPAYDEARYARDLSDSIGATYHEVFMGPQDFVDTMPLLIRAMDEPAAGPGLFPQFVVSRQAKEHVTVVLGGQGGDEIFGGYARYLVAYLEQALKGAISSTQEEKQHLVTLSSIAPNLAVLNDYVPMLKTFWSSGLFEDMDRRYFHLINRTPDLKDLLVPDMLKSWNKESLFESFSREFNHADTLSYINKMTHFDLRAQLPALLQVEDRVSMLVSLESRVPLLDHQVVELVTTMPPALKFQGGKLKHMLKQVAQDLLPRSILERKDKMGFPVPLSKWMVEGPVREFVSDLVLDPNARTRDIFQRQSVERLVSNETPFGRQLWAVLCLELWRREYGV